jgi:signal transduction histidine kinase
MIRTGSSPGGQRSGPVLVWLLPALLTVCTASVAAALVPNGAHIAVIVCGAVATVAVAVLSAEVARRGRALAVRRAQHTEQLAMLEHRLRQQEAATVQLSREQLPEAVKRLQEGEFAEEVLLSTPIWEGLSDDFRAAHQEVLRTVVEAVQAEETLRDAAQRGVVNVARRVQAIVHRQATDLRGMENRHGQNRDFFADLLRLDHGTALIGRLADSIAVLGGARPGRQWSKAVPVYSVLRGAMSRVLDYQRVELHSVADLAIVGPAVEPLIHALAELLDNATRYSPPKTRVHLTAGEVHAGVAIEIEDGGVGLSEEARAHAELRLKEAQAGIDLNDLGEAPRLGLAVVGQLARAYDFQVSLPPSAYGGVRAVLVVPKKLITTAPATGRAHGIGAVPSQEASGEPAAADGFPASARVPGVGTGTETPAADEGGGSRATSRTEAPSYESWLPETGNTAREEDRVQDETPPVVERTASGLPQRRRRSPAQGGQPGGLGSAAASRRPKTDSADEPPPGLWMADLQSGLSDEGRNTASASDNNDMSSGEGE